MEELQPLELCEGIPDEGIKLMSDCGPSPHFAAKQRFGRFQVKSGHQMAGRTGWIGRE